MTEWLQLELSSLFHILNSPAESGDFQYSHITSNQFTHILAPFSQAVSYSIKPF